MTKTTPPKKIFLQRKHPISIDYKWAFVLITIALLAVAAIISDKTADSRVDTPISPNTLHEPLPPQPIVEKPVVLADEWMQEVLELEPVAGKYVYSGKMPGIQTFGTTSTGTTDFATLLQNLSTGQGTTTPPGTTTLPTPTTTTPREFAYVAYADPTGLVGVKTTLPSTGSIITDLFLSAVIQPTTFKVGNEVLRCPLGQCMFLSADTGEFPTFLGLLPTYTKSKAQLLEQPFKFVGVKTLRNRTCDSFETGSGNTFQSLCIDQLTHVPSYYENGNGYSLELINIQTSDYVVETAYPSSMGLYFNESYCGMNAETNAREATIAFLPIKSGWAGQQREMELQLFLPTQNPMIYPSAIPAYRQIVKLAGRRGEKVVKTIPIGNVPENQYILRACVGSDCTATFNCSFVEEDTTTYITPQACEAAGGSVTYDIGDGSTHRDGCGAGKTFLGTVPVGIEGGICCR